MSGDRMQGDSVAEGGLAPLRAEIDRIDAALHGLLMERGEIIDRLIAVKARSGGASAFRPAREAAMMRRLVERHGGILPVTSIEGIWRIIISTFTHVQSPYAVHADMGGGGDEAAAMRDAGRFHFGFTVPLVAEASAAEVIAAVAEARNDLGLVRCAGGGAPTRIPWWDALRDPAAPKVIARLPFVERVDHAAGLPLFVIAKPLAEPEPAAVMLVAASAEGGEPPAPLALVDRCGDSMLVAVPGAASTATLADPVPVGSHAAPFAVPGETPRQPPLRSIPR